MLKQLLSFLATFISGLNLFFFLNQLTFRIKTSIACVSNHEISLWLCGGDTFRIIMPFHSSFLVTFISGLNLFFLNQLTLPHQNINSLCIKSWDIIVIMWWGHVPHHYAFPFIHEQCQQSRTHGRSLVWTSLIGISILFVSFPGIFAPINGTSYTMIGFFSKIHKMTFQSLHHMHSLLSGTSLWRRYSLS